MRLVTAVWPYLFLQVPLEGFKALQGISGPQRFQIHKAYGAPDRLPSAHTW
jgi:E3 ubiquitin-protein ligase HUWE1